MSRITLINPAHLQVKLQYSSLFHPPMGLAYVAAYMRRNGHDVQLIDAVSDAIDQKTIWQPHNDMIVIGLDIKEIIDRIPAASDIIGVSCMSTPAWPYVRNLVSQIKGRFPNIPLVMGGEHVTGSWETILSDTQVDFCVLGEGEAVFEELASELKNGRDFSKVKGIAYRDSGKPVANQRRERIRDIDSLPLPAWDLIKIEKYIEKKLFMGASRGRTMPIIATRGCPCACRFCTAANMWGGKWIPRNTKKVVDEIELYMNKYGADDFHLMDLTAIIRKDWIMRFADEISQRKLKITWQLPVGTRIEAIDKEVTESLMKSGCRDITFAPETGSESSLNMMSKKIDYRHLDGCIKAALESRMVICLFFLIGFPGETLKDIKKTFKLIRRMALIGVHEIAISTFIPIPGTAIFNELKERDPGRFKVTDEFCYSLLLALSLKKTISWNDNITHKQLLRLKVNGMLMFYGISYAIRPWRFVNLLKNSFIGKQDTKVDRVVQEMLYQHRQ